jgi:two-component system response regulator
MQKLHILIAEDDADDRYLVQTAFAERGIKEPVHFVHDGVGLIKYLGDIYSGKNSGIGFPCFILLDLNMPKKDGKEVLRTLKEHPEFRKIPVVVFTTTKNDQEIRCCYELGANTYIVKPVSFEALMDVLEGIRNYWFNLASISV